MRYLIYTFALLVAIVSCQRASTSTPELQELMIKVAINEEISTRAEIESASGTDIVTPEVVDGYIYIISNENVLDIVPLDIEAMNSGKHQLLGAYSPSEYYQIHIIANTQSFIDKDGTIANIDWTNITSSDDINRILYNSEYTLLDASKRSQISMYGDEYSASSGDQILITPAYSYIDLLRIRTKENSPITSYKVNSIFIDNYLLYWANTYNQETVRLTSYSEEAIAAIPESMKDLYGDAPLMSQGQSLTNPTTGADFISNVVELEAGKMWSYPSSSDSRNQIPFLVVELSDIFFDHDSDPATQSIELGKKQYIIVTDYIGSNGNVIYFNEGKRYIIEDIAFDLENLRDDPSEPTPFTVYANIQSLLSRSLITEGWM